MTDKNPYMKLDGLPMLEQKIIDAVSKKIGKNKGVALILAQGSRGEQTLEVNGIYPNLSFHLLVMEDDYGVAKVILDTCGESGYGNDVVMVIKRLYVDPQEDMFVADLPPMPRLRPGEFCITTELFDQIVARIIKEAGA